MKFICQKCNVEFEGEVNNETRVCPKCGAAGKEHFPFIINSSPSDSYGFDGEDS